MSVSLTQLAPLLPRALEGLLPAEAIARATAAAEAAHKRLDEALLSLGLLPETTLTELLRRHFDVADTVDADIPNEPVLSDELAPRYQSTAGVLPLEAGDGELVLAMLDPFDDFAANAVALKTSRRVVRRRISRQLFDRSFASLHGGETTAAGQRDEEFGGPAPDTDVEMLRDAASDAPVIRFVQATMLRALQLGASDIHLRATRDGAEMLFRIDGDLGSQIPPDARQLSSIVSRLKILANLDISERRLPQDGRIRFNIGGQPVDVRLSTMPHIHGEGAVLRILARDVVATTIADLGFSPSIEAGLDRLFQHVDGLILITGPTGSGKTTTLHAALRQMLRPDLNVVTIEDPVEYRVDGAVQVQVDEKIGLTFPKVLRSLLRQDPDVILVGEIRDAETAKIAVQAALTGHLVLATLHTNSAPAAVPRLVDMGVEPYLLAAVMRGVLAQRLVRRNCSRCEAKALELTCPDCNGTGRAGRAAIGELLPLSSQWTERLARDLNLGPNENAALRATGYRPLAEDAADRVRNGEVRQEDLKGLIDVG